MSRLSSALVAVGVAGALGACAPMSQLGYAVPGGPNPPPPPGYRVECTAQPDPTYFLWPSYRSGCQQIIPDAQPVVRARG